MNSPLTYREIVEILTLIKESEHCARLNLEIGDFKLDIQGISAQSTHDTSNAIASQVGNNIKAPSAASGTMQSNPAVAESTLQTPATEAISTANEQLIRAPILGIFYRASEPGAKPYVDVGDQVTPDDTVAVMEVMKLYSPVHAGVTGKILEILVSDGEMVEYDQPLMRVAPLDTEQQV